MEQTSTERTLGIGDFWRVFKRAFFLMLIVGILFTAIHAFWGYRNYSPVYVSDGMISTMRLGAIGTNGEAAHPGNELEYAIYAQPECVQLMKERPVRYAVLEELQLIGKVSPDALLGIISIDPIKDTSFIRVTAKAGSPELARIILDSYMRHSIIALSDSSLKGNAESMGSITVEASLPSAPSNSRFSLLSLVIGFVGAVLVYLAFLVSYIVRDRAEDPSEIASIVGLPLLGVIPPAKKPAPSALPGESEKEA